MPLQGITTRMRAYKGLSFVFFKEKQEKYKNKQKRFVAGGKEEEGKDLETF